MKNKKLRPMLLIVLAALLALGWYCWYSRPQTLEVLFPDFAWDQIQGVSGTYQEYVPAREGYGSLTDEWGNVSLIRKTDPEVTELLALIRSLEFQPMAGSSSTYIPVQEGDFSVTLRIHCGADLIEIEYRINELTVRRGNDTEYFCDFTGHEEAARTVFQFIKSRATPL